MKPRCNPPPNTRRVLLFIVDTDPTCFFYFFFISVALSWMKVASVYISSRHSGRLDTPTISPQPSTLHPPPQLGGQHRRKESHANRHHITTNLASLHSLSLNGGNDWDEKQPFNLTWTRSPHSWKKSHNDVHSIELSSLIIITIIIIIMTIILLKSVPK